MRKTSIAENWSAVEELRMVISRVGEERRTLEAQLGKVIGPQPPQWGGSPHDTSPIVCEKLDLLENTYLT